MKIYFDKEMRPILARVVAMAIMSVVRANEASDDWPEEPDFIIVEKPARALHFVKETHRSQVIILVGSNEEIPVVESFIRWHSDRVQWVHVSRAVADILAIISGRDEDARDVG